MKHLLEIWGDLSGISDALNLPYPTVTSWKRRGIPLRRFPEIIERARQHGVTLTFEMLHAANVASAETCEQGAA